MNKYKYCAVTTAFLAIFASFAFWTFHLEWIPFPRVSDKTVSVVEKLIEQFIPSEPEAVSVEDIEVEALGGHYAEHTTVTSVAASVIANTSVVVVEPVREEVDLPQEEKQQEMENEVLHAAPPNELEQWELKRAWNIAVPSLGIRAPVMLPSLKYWSSQAWDLMEEQMQVGLNHGTVAYPHSSRPGGDGSLIIAGHSSPPTVAAEQSNFGNVFAKLPDIAVGEDITVSTSAAPIRYRVEEKIIVSPTVTSILEQQYDESVLKLITCYPVGTTKNRMIIIAKKVQE